MRILLISVALLVMSCSTLKKNKSVDKSSSKVQRQASVDSSRLDVSKTSVFQNWRRAKIHRSDSSFQKKTVEKIQEWIIINGDTLQPLPGGRILYRQTDRTILDNGQRSSEQFTAGSRQDSGINVAVLRTSVQGKSSVDSTGSASTVTKKVDRKTLLPWWWWIILLLVVVAWLARKVLFKKWQLIKRELIWFFTEHDNS